MVLSNSEMEVELTNDDLKLLSDAILIAMQTNSHAAKLTTSRSAQETIYDEYHRLSMLSRKICAMMEEDDDE